MQKVSLAAAMLTCATAAPASAQATQWPLGVQLGVGGGYGWGGGERENRSTLVADAAVSWRARPGARAGVVIAAGAAVQGNLGSDLVCRPGRASPCVPDYPSFHVLGALVGWEAGRGRGASVRALGGPAYFSADHAGALGIAGRVEVATPAVFHVSAVGAAHGAILPRFRRQGYYLGALTIGVRLE